LHGRKRMIDEDQVGVERSALHLQLFSLAGADEKLGIGFLDACAQRADHRGAGRTSKLAELVGFVRIAPGCGIFAYPARLQEQRALTFA